VVFAHGILGSRNNWRSFARRMIEQRPTWSALLVDLRNHGESHGLAGPHTIEACARDVAEVLATIPHHALTLVGHSFGGKVVLELASHVSAETWVLDSPPGPRVFGNHEIDRVLAAVYAVPLPLATRQALLPILRASGLSEPLAQWMTTNLRPAAEGSGLVWKMALETIPEMLESFAATDLWPFVMGRSSNVPRIVTVRGGKSDRWSEAELKRIAEAVRAGVLDDHVLAEAGHWVHTDSPEELMRLVLSP